MDSRTAGSTKSRRSGTLTKCLGEKKLIDCPVALQVLLSKRKQMLLHLMQCTLIMFFCKRGMHGTYSGVPNKFWDVITMYTLHTVHKNGINPQIKCSGKNDIILNLCFPRLVKNHQTVLNLADILHRKCKMFNFVCTSKWKSKKSY